LKFQPKATGGETYDLQQALMLRVVNAAFRAGAPEHAAALAAHARKTGDTEALIALGDWAEPPRRDRIVGVFRPLADREAKPAVTALHPVLEALLTQHGSATKVAAIQAATELGIKEAGALFAKVALDEQAEGAARAEAIRALGTFQDERLNDVVDRGLGSNDESVRKEATRQLVKLSPAGAAERLEVVLQKGTLGEKQNVLGVLGDLRGAKADQLISEWLDRLIAGQAPPEVHLEIVESAAKRRDEKLKARLAAYEASKPADDLTAQYRETLHGGDAENGRVIFRENVQAQCLRCHKHENSGGDVGPAVDGIAKKFDREFLLQSIVDPSAKIAEGFENLTVTLKQGGAWIGMYKGETDTELSILSPEDGLIKIKKSDIERREVGLSGMPPGMGEILGKRDIRDLVEFLANLK
jgi:quinoprotein glucose dehydrogenase